MRLLGQGRPTSNRRARAWRAAVAAVCGMLALGGPVALAAELDVRLRFAWGSGGQSPQRWQGKITIPGATLSNLQPLGIEADEAAAVRLVNEEIKVTPLVRRAFDGCDVTVRGDEGALVTVELDCSNEAAPKVVTVPLGQVAAESFRAPLDELDSDLLIHRAPGDRLRITIDREHLVFSPGEPLSLQVQPDLPEGADPSSLTIEAALHRVGSAEALAEQSKPYDASSTQPASFEWKAPADEGVYRIKFTVQRPAGLASRLAPWEKGEAIASREMELVVVDPAARLPRLTNSWEVVATIDPSNFSWWQRVPAWTQFDKLPGFSTPRPLGNVRLTPAADSLEEFVTLPVAAPNADASSAISAESSAEAAWQAYLLPVRRVGEPHAVEIELPRGVGQHLGVSIVEPDAAGRVMSFGRDCGVFSEERAAVPGQRGVELHRIVFWPRTKSPALLLSNRSNERPALYGKIRLMRRTSAAPPTAAETEANLNDEPGRLAAAYISAPRFADALGAAEEFDSQSGLSVDGWSTFLTAANRLAQQLHATGYNAAIIAIAGDGSSLANIDGLGSSPRYDTGPLSAAATDPIRKDVLEAMLRVFDREGLKLIPAVRLAAPLPQLEALASAGNDSGSSGIRWIGRDGERWSEYFSVESAAAPHYNVLNAKVQAELAVVTDELLNRYEGHASFGGLALQLDGNGYGVLPGLAWGMDDDTTGRFAGDLNLTLPTDGADRFQQRAALLLGKHLAAWRQWRQDQVSQFYAKLAARVSRDRPELKLVLCTEDVFTGPIAGERLRQAVGGRAALDDALSEVGLDVDQLAATAGICVFRPQRIAAEHSADRSALNQRLNSALELDRAFAAHPQSGELLFHASERVRLASFDAQSPFGADKTFFAVDSPSVAAGHAARQAFAAALARRDFATLATGAESPLLAENDGFAEALRAFKELPLSADDIRTERVQPITLRVYRGASSTTLCLINESRWPVEVDVPLECDVDLVWRQLGVDSAPADQVPSATGDSSTRGSLLRGNQKLTIGLPPYGLHARRYSSRTMKVGVIVPRVSAEARGDMARRITEIEERLAGLNIERPYNELQNPQFELIDDAGRLRGWQPRLGERGAVEVAADHTSPAGRSIHLQSEDGLGVAVQSHLFAIPDTGQIVVRAKVRAADMQPGAQLYAWIEYESGGVSLPQYFSLGDHQLPATWTECEFAKDDLPLAGSGKMRVQFHLTGQGQAWIDDIRLFDLRFADAQRVDLSKRLIGAKAALNEGNLLDCQRLVDGYLPRRLVEHVPAPALASKPAATAPPPESEEKGFAPRIRGMVPKILR